MPTEKPIGLLILGLGNVLCGDDGLGAAAVHRLARAYALPSGARVVDGGTLGLSLLPYLEDADQAILVDAIRAEGLPAGSLVRLEGDEVGPAVAGRLSPHQVGVADLLEGARLLERYPRRLVLLGIVPASLGLGIVRSPAVEARLDELIERVAEEARSFGFPLSARSRDEALPAEDADGPVPARDVARALGL